MIKKISVLIVVFAVLGAVLGASDVIFAEMRETIVGTIIYGATLGGIFGVLILILDRLGFMSDLFKVFKTKLEE